MDPSIESLATLLFAECPEAIAALHTAREDWQAFYDKHSSVLDSDLHAPQGPTDWELLIDVGTLHHHVFEADHSECPAEVIRGLSALATCQRLDVDWQPLAEMPLETPVSTMMQLASSAIETAGKSLVLLNKYSDSFPFAVMNPESLDQAYDLTENLENGQFVIVAES